MREIVLDTETTGFEPAEGHRIVEIGAVELLNHLPTGRTYHQYINPQRSMPEEAYNIHKLGDAFLSDKPLFKDIAADFLNFIGDSKLVIHNASFDIKFLNAELSWVNLPELSMSRAIDTVMMARRKFPGSPASLDSLCKRFGIDNSMRTFHGALLDSEILAEVYLELIGGRQPGLVLAPTEKARPATGTPLGMPQGVRPRPLPVRLSDAERTEHDRFVAKLGEQSIWKTWAS